MTNATDRFGDACTLAESLGYIVRRRWLDGVGAPPAKVDEKKWIIVDDMKSHEEQAESVLRALNIDPNADVDQRRAA